MASLLRGSTWSKWDLHIHTPCSIINNYGGNTEAIWEKFILKLESLPDEVEVIGINDYYFIDGYEKIMDYKFNKGRLTNIKKVFPVLEFRIDTFASASESNMQKVNLHILFDIDENDLSNELKKIREQFISQIHLSKLKEHSTITLSKENLQKMGEKLQQGFAEIIPPTDEVLNLIDSHTWKDTCFAFLGYTEWNNLNKGGQIKPHKNALYQIASAFFTSSMLDISKKESILHSFGNRVLLHSLDIHDFDKFDDYRCLTWIKADRTFEGLKQILIEPNERVVLQENNPAMSENKTYVLDSVKILNGIQWFSNEVLPLSTGLVSIIGEKGSGKTALLDIMAVANGEGIYEKDDKKPYSFYNRAKTELIGLKIEIAHLNSSVFEYSFAGADVLNRSNKNAKLRYLSLKELESYCDDGEKFQAFIKDIIFSTCPDVKKYDEESINIVKKIEDLNFTINTLYNKTKEIHTLKQALQVKKDELNSHIKNEPKVKTNFSEEQQKVYTKLLNDKHQLTIEDEKQKTEKEEILSLNQWLANYETSINQQFANDFITKCNTLTYLKKDITNNIQMTVQIDKEPLRERARLLKEDIDELRAKIDANSIEIEPYEIMNKSMASERSIIDQWVQKKALLSNESEKIEIAISNVEKDIVQRKTLINQVIDLYIQLAKNKLKQKSEYENLKNVLEANNNITFDVLMEFNESEYWKIEDNIVNHNNGNNREMIKSNIYDRLIKFLKCLNAYEDEDPLSELRMILEEVYSENWIIDVFGEKRTVDTLLKKGISLNKFYDWLYSDCFKVNYAINYRGRRLETLSPGQKGLVLMKLFLKLDRSNKPLLIDQPEDNLDNKSVYNDLVNDIKEIKKKRQIIIATHNPNLVVNTDSEQVIIAKFKDDPSEGDVKITYSSGSLEDKFIRESVCEILEGGDIAFKKREQRYDIKA